MSHYRRLQHHHVTSKMVYYGKISKGCQRCRGRKVKCDERKPGCMKCERAKVQCPGFRDLNGVLFRDESDRIIRKARKLRYENEVEQASSLEMQQALPALAAGSECSIYLLPINISAVLSHPINEVGAHFFFAKYTCEDPPFSKEYNTWLTRVYWEDSPDHALRAAIEAAGMAVISNIFYAPDIACKSKEQYGRALAAMKKALGDPVESLTDTTLMTVIILGLFEFITMEDAGHYQSWSAHIDGATALLQLRGQEQFNYERGGQLFSQLRSQVLYCCVQQDIPAPAALLKMTQEFSTSAMGELRRRRKPSPLGDACLRLLELRSLLKCGHGIADFRAIHQVAVEMDREFEFWRETLPSSWNYVIDDVNDNSPGMYFVRKRHIYNSPWTAQVWNNWRTLRILVNKIILENEARSGTVDSAQGSAALSIIHQMSTEICISAPHFVGSPHIGSTGLIWPLLVVAQEEVNPHNERFWAVEQLRRISSTMGIRQAGFLADAISKRLSKVRR